MCIDVENFPHATFARNCHMLLLVSVEVCVDIIHCKFQVLLCNDNNFHFFAVCAPLSVAIFY